MFIYGMDFLRQCRALARSGTVSSLIIELVFLQANMTMGLLAMCYQCRRLPPAGGILMWLPTMVAFRAVVHSFKSSSSPRLRKKKTVIP